MSVTAMSVTASKQAFIACRAEVRLARVEGTLDTRDDTIATGVVSRIVVGKRGAIQPSLELTRAPGESYDRMYDGYHSPR